MGIGVSDKALETHQHQTAAAAIKQRYPDAVKMDVFSLPSKINQRDVFERSDSNRIFTGYDVLDIEEVESIRS